MKCTSCNKGIENDSGFCRYCGQRVQQTDVEVQAVLARTAAFLPDLQQAVDAINEFLNRWSDRPETWDVLFTRQCIRCFVSLTSANQGKFGSQYEDVSGVANGASGEIPARLANGVLAQAIVADEQKRKEAAALIRIAQDGCAKLLEAVFKAANEERASLMPDGETLATKKRITMDAAYRDAEVHYASYQKGDYAAARAGFAYLKQIAPTDAYFRNILGATLLLQRDGQAALREFLYGFYLNPEHPHLAIGAMQVLCGYALYPAALEIARHHEKHPHPKCAPEDQAKIDCWALLARGVTASVALTAAKVQPEHCSGKVRDLMDEFTVPERAWLSTPKPVEAKSILEDARVFISYRRAGGLEYARRLERALKAEYPAMHVFRDETRLVTAYDFIDQLQGEIDRADVCIALIDKDWSGVAAQGRSRFLDASDMVRREIQRALQRSIVLFPVLLDDARLPANKDLPEEMRALRRLQATKLAEATFDDDVNRLVSDMGDRLRGRTAQEGADERRFQAEMAELEELEKKDPKAAKRKREELFGSAIRSLPKVMTAKAVDGKGVATQSVVLPGVWECTATGANWQITLHFDTQEGDGNPFEGSFVTKPQGGARTDEDIRGMCVPIMDRDEDKLLGLFLDGTKAGREFKLRIPFDRQLGKDLVGSEKDGITFVSRNVKPSQPTAKPF